MQKLSICVSWGVDGNASLEYSDEPNLHVDNGKISRCLAFFGATMDDIKSKKLFWQTFGYTWKFGYTIAIPLVLLGIGGRVLDNIYTTHPWFFIGGVVISLVVSTTFLIIRAKRILLDLQQTIEQQKNNNSNNR